MKVSSGEVRSREVRAAQTRTVPIDVEKVLSREITAVQIRARTWRRARCLRRHTAAVATPLGRAATGAFFGNSAKPSSGKRGPDKGAECGTARSGLTEATGETIE